MRHSEWGESQLPLQVEAVTTTVKGLSDGLAAACLRHQRECVVLVLSQEDHRMTIHPLPLAATSRMPAPELL